MIHLFFISYDFSGAKTYAHQLIPYLRDKVDLVVSELCFGGDYLEFVAEDVGEESTSGIGWKFFFPDQEFKPPTGSGFTDAFIGPPLQLLRSWFQPIADEIVIFHNNSEYSAEILHRARCLLNCYTISTIHFLPKHYTWKELDSYTEVLTETKHEQYTQQLRLSDQLICVTEFAANSLKKNDLVGLDKMSVIYNGYTDERVLHRVDRDKYGLCDSDIVLLFVGRITPEKGIDSLLSAFKKVCAKYPKVKLLLVGGGDYRLIEADVKQCRERVVYMGPQPVEVVGELYDLADIGIIPSKYEQCSYVALEMMSRCLPVVATNTPGLRELFVDERSGLLVDVERGYSNDGLLDILINVDMLVAQIERLVCSVALRACLAQNGYERWQEYFTAKRMAEQTYDVYKSLTVP